MLVRRTNKLCRPFSVVTVVSVMVFTGCAATKTQDPLQQSKKLVREGHASLYNNGAFGVPQTSIRLIPSGPSTLDMTAQLMGTRAREAFLRSLKNARDSVSVVSEGTTLTFRSAKGMHEATDRTMEELRRFVRDNSTLLIYRGSTRGKEIIGKSWDFSKETAADFNRFGIQLVETAQAMGDDIAHTMNEQGSQMIDSSQGTAAELVRGGRARSAEALSSGLTGFIEGYATIPSKLKSRGTAIGERLDHLDFAERVKEDNEQRRQWSQKMTELVGQTVTGYSTDISNSFQQGKRELEDYETTGVSLAALRSLRWILQGLFWDAIIEPVGNISGASVGYIGVNAVAFPIMVVTRGGVATTELAVEITWNTSKAAYDLVAPSGVAAVAGIYSVLDFSASHIGAGAVVGTGTMVGYGEKGLGQVVGVMVKATGYTAGKTVQYIGVPLAAANITIGGGTIGVAAGTAGVVTGSALRVSGELASAGTYVFGNTLAGTTMVAGTTASVVAGTTYGFYEVAKAVTVPVGHQLSGGLVLGYGALSQLAAHSILGASDFAYLVLSLEGPRWVVYAVRGRLGKGEDLPPGAVLDLKKMQESGEEIRYLPVSDEEMKNVIDSINDDLPRVE